VGVNLLRVGKALSVPLWELGLRSPPLFDSLVTAERVRVRTGDASWLPRAATT